MSYRWRDPARLTPGRLAQLAASGRPEPAGRDAQAVARQARIRQYAALRDSGLNKGQAAAAMGIGRDTARQYERTRNGSTP